MGLVLSRILKLFSGNQKVRILMLGLDAAGKTTILYKLKLKETVNTVPTVAFNVETISPCKNITFSVWDIGGQDKIRRLWRHYFQGAEGIIFVVDSADKERIFEVREELTRVLQHSELNGVPVVVVANKQDLLGAIGPDKMAEELSLYKHTKNPWRVQGTCATAGDGLYEAMEALAKMVKAYQGRRIR
ncbi:ADP-ribosylation factor [Nematostella vectensis]|uniref:ADP-ribosylation factor n=1 Tax=Nematostella vectensis TaxID=45351 RepID=UPI0020770492|nr:ADP-ribosylation factor [Nematostella vectensis]